MKALYQCAKIAQGLQHSIRPLFALCLLYFMYYSRVVIILFSTGLYESAFSKSALYKSVFSTYSSCKTRFSFFCVLVYRAFASLA